MIKSGLRILLDDAHNRPELFPAGVLAERTASLDEDRITEPEPLIAQATAERGEIEQREPRQPEKRHHVTKHGTYRWR